MSSIVVTVRWDGFVMDFENAGGNFLVFAQTVCISSVGLVAGFVRTIQQGLCLLRELARKLPSLGFRKAVMLVSKPKVTLFTCF